MGKHKVTKLFAGLSTQPEPPDSWMRDLQLQTVSVDPIWWTPGPRPSTLWRAFKPQPRARRLN